MTSQEYQDFSISVENTILEKLQGAGLQIDHPAFLYDIVQTSADL